MDGTAEREFHRKKHPIYGRVAFPEEIGQPIKSVDSPSSWMVYLLEVPRSAHRV